MARVAASRSEVNPKARFQPPSFGSAVANPPLIARESNNGRAEARTSLRVGYCGKLMKAALWALNRNRRGRATTKWQGGMNALAVILHKPEAPLDQDRFVLITRAFLIQKLLDPGL